MRVRLYGLMYSMALTLLFWQGLSALTGSPAVPAPAVVLAEFFRIFPSKIAMHLAYSLMRVFAALLASLVLGVGIGVMCAESQLAERLITPLAYLLMPIPKIAFMPVLMVFLGLGNSSKVTLIIIIIIFQFIISARDAVKSIPRELLLYERTLRLSLASRLAHFILPAILPDIFTALRINLGIAIAVLFFSESFATKYGIGYFIMNSWVMADYVTMASGILAISLMGILLFLLLDILEQRLCRG